MLEIDVDVRGLVALAGDEALEQHFHARRIDRGDAEAIAHRGVGRRAAALTQDVFAPRELHDVVDGEKEGFVARFGNERKLVLDQLAHLGALRFGRPGEWKASLEAFLGQPAQIRSRRLPGRHDLFRIFIAQLFQREVAALGDDQRFG